MIRASLTIAGLVAALSLSPLLAGCGNKGPLYLPQVPAASSKTGPQKPDEKAQGKAQDTAADDSKVNDAPAAASGTP